MGEKSKITNFEEFIEDINSVRELNLSENRIEQSQVNILNRIMRRENIFAKMSSPVRLGIALSLIIIAFVALLTPFLGSQFKKNSELAIIDSTLSFLDSDIYELQTYQDEIAENSLHQVEDIY